MEVRLNIYTDETLKEIEKTYVQNDFKLATSVAEDLLDLINIDMFIGTDENAAMKELFKVVLKGRPQFKTLLKRVFDGLTDDEIKRTNLKEFVQAIYNIAVYTIAGLFDLADEKN